MVRHFSNFLEILARDNLSQIPIHLSGGDIMEDLSLSHLHFPIMLVRAKIILSLSP